MTNNHIYFVVLDPTSERQPALERAVALAQITDATLVAFVCTWLDEQAKDPFASQKKAKHTALEQAQTWGQQQVQSATNAGLNVEVDVYWNADWYKAIPRAAKDRHADLIVKSTFRHSRGERLLQRTSDYTLLRYASCPVLLARSSNTVTYTTLLAALDLSGNEAHATLNDSILGLAHHVAADCDASLHMVTALEQPPMAPMEPGWIPPTDYVPKRSELAHEFGLIEENIHVYENNPKTAIVTCVEQLNADLLVIGTAARRGLSGALIGNTAEKVLDAVTCDLLVVS